LFVCKILHTAKTLVFLAFPPLIFSYGNEFEEAQKELYNRVKFGELGNFFIYSGSFFSLAIKSNQSN